MSVSPFLPAWPMKKSLQIHLRLTLWLAAAALAIGCAAVPSPTNTTTWKDPDFKGPPFRKTVRRRLERPEPQGSARV